MDISNDINRNTYGKGFQATEDVGYLGHWWLDNRCVSSAIQVKWNATWSQPTIDHPLDDIHSSNKRMSGKCTRGVNRQINGRLALEAAEKGKQENSGPWSADVSWPNIFFWKTHHREQPSHLDIKNDTGFITPSMLL